jgi:hypothetical protein
MLLFCVSYWPWARPSIAWFGAYHCMTEQRNIHEQYTNLLHRINDYVSYV